MNDGFSNVELSKMSQDSAGGSADITTFLRNEVYNFGDEPQEQDQSDGNDSNKSQSSLADSLNDERQRIVKGGGESVSGGDQPLGEKVSMYSGLNGRERAFFSKRPTLEATEDQLQKWMSDNASPLTYEIGAVYVNGQLEVVKRGPDTTEKENAVVQITESDLKATNIDDLVIVTHNHPQSTPLSCYDVVFASKKNLKEIRAVGEQGTFSIQRLDARWDTVTPEEILQVVNKTGPAEWRKVCPKEDRNLRPQKEVKKAGATFAEDPALCEHFAYKALAEQYPDKIQYRHPDEKAFIQSRKALYEDRPEDFADRFRGLAYRTLADFGNSGKPQLERKKSF
jgi:hypothetical protein